MDAGDEHPTLALPTTVPIYDYRCQVCHKRFTVFFRSYSEVVPVRCRHCGSEQVGRLAPRVATVTSEDERLDRLSDPSALGDVDENDPSSVPRWAKRLGREVGEDVGDEFDDAMDELGDDAGDAEDE